MSERKCSNNLQRVSLAKKLIIYKYMLVPLIYNAIEYILLFSRVILYFANTGENIIIIKGLLIYIRNCGLVLYQQKNDELH